MRDGIQKWSDFSYGVRRRYWLHVLKINGGWISKASAMGGCHRQSLYRTMKLLNIEKPTPSLHPPPPIIIRVERWDDYWQRVGNQYWRSVLWITGGAMREAAELAGVNRTDMYKCLRRFSIEIESQRVRHSHRGQWDRDIPSSTQAKPQ